MYYSAIRDFDVANGPGVRVSLFVSGCSHECEGCFQPETWNPKYGDLFLDKDLDHIIQSLKPDYIDGITILGGDPLMIYNIEKVEEIITRIRNKYSRRKTIWLYTGFTLDDIISDINFIYNEGLMPPPMDINITKSILSNIDYLVDGPFILDKKDMRLQFRGSSNQRLIDMYKTMRINNIFSNKKVYHKNRVDDTDYIVSELNLDKEYFKM